MKAMPVGFWIPRTQVCTLRSGSTTVAPRADALIPSRATMKQQQRRIDIAYTPSRVPAVARGDAIILTRGGIPHVG
jgi:hypothetical protein